MNKKPLSLISLNHYVKLVFRSVLFLVALALYVLSRIEGSDKVFYGAEASHVILGTIWLVFVVEMIFRFFPSGTESMGCQKQFGRNFVPTREDVPVKQSGIRTFWVVFSWAVLNGVLGILHLTDVLDGGIMVLVALLYSVCDLVCILFFCPFQTWIMKNKCCGTCRIYNWDYAMMCTPLMFVNNVFAGTLAFISVLLLLSWEIRYRRHPKRFCENTNAALRCTNCQEKLCSHKTQLRGFLLKYRRKLMKLHSEQARKDK